VENNYLSIKEQVNYADKMTECGKDNYKCKNDTRKKYQAIYNKNKQEKITQINKELSRPVFLRTMINQEIKSSINLVNNRPFREEITKIPEQNLNGVEVISSEKYVSRAEVRTKKDLKATIITGINFIPVVRTIDAGVMAINGAVEDYKNDNIDNTINNSIEFIVPKIMTKIEVPKNISEGASAWMFSGEYLDEE
jgi:hypothetical protein